jgi:hypothetical protein
MDDARERMLDAGTPEDLVDGLVGLLQEFDGAAAQESNRRSKHQSTCQKSESELNADYNASKNIARNLLKRLHSGQTSSGGGAPCQCALNSGTLTLNGEYTASVDSTAEGESTDKPTTSVVGH